MTPTLSGTPTGSRRHRRVRRPGGLLPERPPPAGAAGRLDPAGGSRVPRRITLLRASVVALLLLTAAAVLHGGRVERVTHPAGDDPATTATVPVTPTTSVTPGSTPAAASGPGASDGPVSGPGAAPGPQPDPDPEPVTGPERVSVPEDLVGVSVPLAEPAMLTVLAPGDRVDLLTVATPGAAPELIASGASVLAVDQSTRALVLALTEAQAHAVLSGGSSFAVIARP